MAIYGELHTISVVPTRLLVPVAQTGKEYSEDSLGTKIRRPATV